MTVQFNVNGTFADDPNAKIVFKSAFKAKELWWITRCYITHSEQEPIKWEAHDSSNYSHPENAMDGFGEWVDYLSKLSNVNGYKVVTLCINMTDGTSTFQKTLCKEHFKPVEKVYINGPKKKPFPLKAAKHF